MRPMSGITARTRGLRSWAAQGHQRGALAPRIGLTEDRPRVSNASSNCSA